MHRGLRRAFTLVELLVVIAIIAILIAILLGVLSAARSRAESIKCAANLRQIGTAIIGYAQDNKGSLPYGYIQFRRSEDTSWMNLIHQYMVKHGERRQGMELHRITKAYHCPSEILPEGQFSYTGHPALMPVYGFASYPKPAKLERLRTAVIFATDATQYRDPRLGWVSSFIGFGIDNKRFERAYLDGDWARVKFDPTNPEHLQPIDPGPNKETAAPALELDNIRWRHRDRTPGSPRGYANFVFSDGHVAEMGQGEVRRQMVLLPYLAELAAP